MGCFGRVRRGPHYWRPCRGWLGAWTMCWIHGKLLKRFDHVKRFKIYINSLVVARKMDMGKVIHLIKQVKGKIL